MGDMGISKSLSKLHNWRCACQLNIELDDHYHSKIYSSGSIVRCRLIISASSTFKAGSIRVSLDGLTRIRTAGQCITTTTVHRFLKVDYFAPDIAELIQETFIEGHVYTVLFHFAFPAKLDSTTCTHKVTSTNVREQHLCLPSTIRGWGHEDMSPDTVAIEYAINACIEPISQLDSRPSRSLTFKKTVKFITKSRECPPLHVASTTQRYALQATQALRQHSFRRSSGIVNVTATQPEPLRLHPYGKAVIPAFIDVSLTFDPSEDAIPPPQVDAISLCIRSYTWCQANPSSYFPGLHEVPNIKQPFCVTLPAEVQPSMLAWSKHVSISQQAKSSKAFYNSTLRLPLSILVTTKTVLPTFHSCLVSRTYDVCLRLTFGKRESTVATPLQIIAEI